VERRPCCILTGMRRAAGAVLACAVVLAGCASTEDQLQDRLQERLDGVHQHYLEVRAHDPYSTGGAALETLDPYGYAVSTSVDGDVVTLVRTIGVSIREDKWLGGYDEYTLGGCVVVVVEAGKGGSDRGIVATGPVDCPPGTDVDADHGVPVDTRTTDLDARRDDVEAPPPDRSVCLSGELCTEGGG